MSIKIQVLGVKEAQKYLNSKEANVGIKLASAMNKATLFVEGEVKQSIAGHKAEPTSVDTGRFLNSVQGKPMKDNGIIFSDVEYSKYLEYGTTRIKARRHFTNSANRSKDKVKQIIDSELRKI